MKAVNVKVMDVRKVTDVADCMVLASGNSDRHVRSIADKVVEKAKAAGFRPMGMEGQRDGEWVLVDLNDVIVHVMLPRVREFYGLEGLWESRHRSRSRPAKPPARLRSLPAPAPRARKSAAKRKGKAASAPRRAKPAKKEGGSARQSADAPACASR